MIAAVENGRWVWGLGDPSPGAIFVTVFYFVVALLCGFVTRRRWQVTRDFGPQYDGKTGNRFWVLLTLLLVLLGINKQADLQSLVTLFGRDILRDMGLYENRREIQTLFIGVVVLIGALGVLVFLWQIRKSSWWSYLAVLGVAVQVVFIVIRATSFHHIDRLLGVRIQELNSIKFNLVLESTGLTLMLVAALGELLQLRGRRVSAVNEVSEFDDGFEDFIT
ncbi:MAG: hypothetical protein JNL58_31125 [Planctomyces sp.]|nr:hypothetical protein [Planctomyces sp.]